MDAREIRQMTDEALLDSIEDQKEALFNLRLQEASGQLEDPTSIRRTRKDIARLYTVLRERQLAAKAVANKDEK